MASMNDVLEGLADEPAFNPTQEGSGVTADALPDRGTFSEAPYPGRYVLQLPDASVLEQCFDLLDTREWGTPPGSSALWAPFAPGDPKGGKRIIAKLRGAAALTIIKAPHGHEELVGEPLETSLSNVERDQRTRRAKDQGAPEILASDLTYFLVKTRFSMQAPPNGLNKAFMQALIACAGKQFSADWEWFGRCDEERAAWIAVQEEDGSVGYREWRVDSTGSFTEDPSGAEMKGCGARIYFSKWPKQGGIYLNRAVCAGTGERLGKCGASLRPFGNLRNFGPAA